MILVHIVFEVLQIWDCPVNIVSIEWPTILLCVLGLAESNQFTDSIPLCLVSDGLRSHGARRVRGRERDFMLSTSTTPIALMNSLQARNAINPAGQLYFIAS